MKKVFFLLPSLVSGCFCLAQRPSSTNHLLTAMDQAVDKAAQAYLANPNTAGLSIGIVKDGKIFFTVMVKR